jgi:hypothetical protein
MSLAERLNLALAQNGLRPVAVPEIEPEAPIEEVPIEEDELRPEYDLDSLVRRPPKETKTPGTYKTLEEGLKSAHKHEPDEFDTIIIVVEKVADKIQLPMKAGGYIVDDIQKKSDGRYEVHLVSDQK